MSNSNSLLSIFIILNSPFFSSSCKCELFDQTSVSKFFSAARGRLGNHMLNYALLLQLNISLGVQSLMDEESEVLLKHFFVPESIVLSVMQKLNLCPTSGNHFEPYNDHIRPLLTDPKYRVGHLLHLWPAVHSNGITSGYSIDAHQCPEHQKLVKAYYHTLRRMLRLRPELLNKANEIINKVVSEYKKRHKVIEENNNEDLFIVGVHNRRTDHIEFVRRVQGKKPLGKAYFRRAMDNFREEHEHTIFLVVSDDMEWARKNIRNENEDIFFVGLGDGKDFESVGIDLALLVLSNATITSRGTFGTMAAVLNGGEHYTEYGVIVQDNEDSEELILF